MESENPISIHEGPHLHFSVHAWTGTDSAFKKHAFCIHHLGCAFRVELQSDRFSWAQIAVWHSSCSRSGQLKIEIKNCSSQNDHEKTPILPILHAEISAYKICPAFSVFRTVSFAAFLFSRPPLSERPTSDRCDTALLSQTGTATLLEVS